MKDRIETIFESLIQHGPLNRRIYLMKLAATDVPTIIPAMARLAKRNGYGKIIAKVPQSHAGAFTAAGFATEAEIPGYGRGRRDLRFMARFMNDRRRREYDPEQVRRTLRRADAPETRPAAGSTWETDRCRVADVPEMSRIYRDVFDSYPFPIHDSGYLKQSLGVTARYFCIRRNHRPVALAAAEIDSHNQAVEMTDFAVLPEWRRNGFAGALLRRMESEMIRQGMATAYTIARISSPGMNRLFRRSGYARAGKLTNNTHIGGRIESMLVWYKRLKK